MIQGENEARPRWVPAPWQYSQKDRTYGDQECLLSNPLPLPVRPSEVGFIFIFICVDRVDLRLNFLRGLSCLFLVKRPFLRTRCLDPLADPQFHHLAPKRFGLTMAFISHDLGVVHYIADCIAVRYRGEIVQSGSSGNVFERPRCPGQRGCRSIQSPKLPLQRPRCFKNSPPALIPFKLF